MNRLHRNDKNYVFNGIDQTDGVYNLSDENFKDDTLETGVGDIDGSDPSMAGYNKGWQMDPYQQRYYADKRINKEIKEAAKETMEIDYSAEGYAKEILSLWSEADGPLQNFFEAFTMNKMDNNLIKDIATILNNKGYTVHPILTDRRSRYANVITKLNKLAKLNDTDKLFNYYSQVFPDDVVLELIKDDITTLNKEGYSVTGPECDGIIEYYIIKYPDSNVSKLLDISTHEQSQFNEFKDLQLSDESLNALEDILNEQSEPIYNGPGTNEEDTDRSDIGVPPNTYEVRLSNRLKKKL